MAELSWLQLIQESPVHHERGYPYEDGSGLLEKGVEQVYKSTPESSVPLCFLEVLEFLPRFPLVMDCAWDG